MMLWRVLVVVAVTVVPGCELSTDPVSETCEPLCQYELEAERLCAVQKGCYEQHIVNNDVLFIQCWQPCWKSAKMNCLSTCRDQYSNIKQKCSQQCASSLDAFCPGFCFAMTLDTLVHGSSLQPHGGEEIKPPGAEKTDDTDQITPPGPTPTADDTQITAEITQPADDNNQTTMGPVQEATEDDDLITAGRTVIAPPSA